jgi:hypothetical protein
MEIDWTCHDEATWTDAADAAGFVAFQQGWCYGRAAAAMGATVRHAVIRDGTQHLALAQVLDKRGLRLLSRGPLWLAPLSMRDKRRVVRRLASIFGATMVTPEDVLAGPGLVPLVTSRHQAIWDLRPEPRVLRAGLHGKWRNMLATCERAALRFGRNRDGALASLLAAEAEQRASRGYRALPPAFTQALPQAAMRVWDWREGGAVQAAMAFVRHGLSASYHLGWAGPVARARSVHQAMLWQAAMALRAEGVHWLDLGDVNTDEAPGLARFKLRTGAELRRLGATAWVLPG